MKDNKLIESLSSLDVYARNRFKKFIESPYFNANTTLVKYYASIDDNIRKNSLTSLSKEKLWDATFPGSPLDQKKQKKIHNDLINLFEEFLIQEALSQQPFLKQNLLLEGIQSGSLDKLHNSSLSKAKRWSDRSLEKSGNYFYQNYRLERNIFNLTNEFDRKKKSKRELRDFNVFEISNALDSFYIIEKLKLSCTLLSWKRLFKLEETLSFIDKIEEHILENQLTAIPGIAVFYHIMLSLRRPEEESYYFELRKLVKRHIAIFSKSEQRDIYDALISYSVGKINKGKSEYTEILFESYLDALDKEVILNNDNEVSPTTFRNIVQTALRSNKLDWAESFIRDKKYLLNVKHRENAVNFSLARLYLYKNEYEKVIDVLRSVEFEDVWYNLNSKTILLAAYYELKEYISLFSLIDSFRVYVRRNKAIPETRKENYMKLLTYIKKLSNLTKYKKIELEKLKLEISTTQGIVNRPWLLQKIDEKLGLKK